MGEEKIKRMREMVKRINQETEEFANTPEGREMDLRMDFALNLLKALKRQKLTKADFCRKINMKPPQFTRIIQGDENITMRMISRISFGLGMPADRLFKVPKERGELVGAGK